MIAADGNRPLADRRRFRSLMVDHRFGELRPDIWMRPVNLPAPAPSPDAGWIVVSGALLGEASDELARRLWDLDAIAAGAHTLLGDLDRVRHALDWADPTSIPPIFTTCASIVRFLRSDPLLPPEMLPTAWPVDALRESYDDAERDLQSLLRTFVRGRHSWERFPR